MVIQNTAELRSLNKKKIISQVRLNGPMTKKDIASRTELSFSTVSNLCNLLMEESILQTESSNSSSGGRIPGLLSIRPRSRVFLCLNIIGSKEAEYALVDLNNEIIASKCQNIEHVKDFKELVALLYQEAMALMQQESVQDKDLVGVGAAAPGIQERDKGRLLNATNPLLQEMPLLTEMEKIFRRPVHVENESNLLVLATSLFEEKGFSGTHDLIYIYLGEGLGAGILCNGKLISGSQGLGGEISHIPIGIRNYACPCGKAGCIERELSLEGFLRKYRELPKNQPDEPQDDWNAFVKQVLAGEPEAMGVVEENGRLLGVLMSILGNLHNPAAIYLGGIISPFFETMLPFIQKEANERMTVRGLQTMDIRNSTNSRNLVLKGCAELVFQDWRI